MCFSQNVDETVRTEAFGRDNAGIIYSSFDESCSRTCNPVVPEFVEVHVQYFNRNCSRACDPVLIVSRMYLCRCVHCCSTSTRPHARRAFARGTTGMIYSASNESCLHARVILSYGSWLRCVLQLYSECMCVLPVSHVAPRRGRVHEGHSRGALLPRLSARESAPILRGEHRLSTAGEVPADIHFGAHRQKSGAFIVSGVTVPAQHVSTRNPFGASIVLFRAHRQNSGVWR